METKIPSLPFQVIVKHSYEATSDVEASLQIGTTHQVISVDPRGAWFATRLQSGVVAWFPSNYVNIVHNEQNTPTHSQSPSHPTPTPPTTPSTPSPSPSLSTPPLTTPSTASPSLSTSSNQNQVPTPQPHSQKKESKTKLVRSSTNKETTDTTPTKTPEPLQARSSSSSTLTSPKPNTPPPNQVPSVVAKVSGGGGRRHNSLTEAPKLQEIPKTFVVFFTEEDKAKKSIVYNPKKKLIDILNHICAARGSCIDDYIVKRADDGRPIIVTDTLTLEELGINEIRFLSKSGQITSPVKSSSTPALSNSLHPPSIVTSSSPSTSPSNNTVTSRDGLRKNSSGPNVMTSQQESEESGQVAHDDENEVESTPDHDNHSVTPTPGYNDGTYNYVSSSPFKPMSVSDEETKLLLEFFNHKLYSQLEQKSRRYKMKTYKATFTGKELTDWFIRNPNIHVNCTIHSKDDAILVAKKLMVIGVVVQVALETMDYREDFIYKFVKQDKRSKTPKKERKDSIVRKNSKNKVC
eukprot:TRINITY_DN1870_c0_g1_i2.p1 TRINITY_DN1870_c0_g1~~TRINITY_DN1870_c0_g1_i2.p1  ORF type:complete len:520 (+),score=127.58 TRINITY_DN1870_c0_g1_i2:64-1623(+)